MGAEALTKRINEAQNTLVQTQSLMRGFANHVALLIGVLIVIFFALLFVYRLYASRRLRLVRCKRRNPFQAKP
jgi:preprotein translocase subunit SecG